MCAVLFVFDVKVNAILCVLILVNPKTAEIVRWSWFWHFAFRTKVICHEKTTSQYRAQYRICFQYFFLVNSPREICQHFLVTLERTIIYRERNNMDDDAPRYEISNSQRRDKENMSRAPSSHNLCQKVVMIQRGTFSFLIFYIRCRLYTRIHHRNIQWHRYSAQCWSRVNDHALLFLVVYAKVDCIKIDCISFIARCRRGWKLNIHSFNHQIFIRIVLILHDDATWKSPQRRRDEEKLERGL